MSHLHDCRERQLHASLPADAGEYGTLYAALEGTLAHLEESLARHAAMLAVFPEDTAIPTAVLAQLWRDAAGAEVDAAGAEVDVAGAEVDVASLEQWNLIDVDWKKRCVALIDLHHDYLRCRGKSELAGWHAHLLGGCGRSAVGVDANDGTDGYWTARRWIYHLREGGGAAVDAVKSTIVGLGLKACVEWGSTYNLRAPI